MPERRCCLWCQHAFTPRATGGKAQRFCSPRCRRDFHAARAWALAAVNAGTLSVAVLRNKPQHNAHVRYSAKRRQPVPV